MINNFLISPEDGVRKRERERERKIDYIKRKKKKI